MTCPQMPSRPRCHDCPGADACRARVEASIERADAELARRRAAGEPVARWGTTAEDFAGFPDKEPPPEEVP